MKPWETLAEAPSESGGKLVLQRRDRELVIRVDGHVLMSTRTHESEIALADVARELVPDARTILVGGLGLGFTLRAVLERLPRAQVTVAELSPAIVEWNRRFVDAQLLDDPRVTVRTLDVGKCMTPSSFDAILLDVDNGPSALSRRENRALYGPAMLKKCLNALKPNGVYVVWSAGADDAFLRRMREAGFAATQRTAGNRGSRHVLFVGRSLTNG